MNDSSPIPESLIHRNSNGVHVFVNPHSGGKFVTDDFGADVIELIRQECDEERLAELIANRHAINPYEAAARYIAFKNKLETHRMLVEDVEEPQDVPTPGTGFLEVTRRCDTRCRLCYISSGEDKPDTLTKEEIFAVIDQMADIRIQFIALSGGDPLTRPDMLEILTYIRRAHGLTAGISTSLLSLTEPAAQRMKELKVLVQVSLDGSRPEINDWNRGKGTFDRAMKGVELLRKHEIPFRFAYVINKRNLDDVEDMVDLGIALGAEEVAFGKVRIAGRAEEHRESVQPSTEEMASAYHRLYRKDVQTRHTGLQIRCKHNQGLLTGLRERVGRLPCGAGRTFIQVSYNGDIVPCSLLSGRKEFRLGNVREDNLADIWRDSHVYQFFRQTTVEDIPVCKDCPAKHLCGGGCRADAYLNYGGLREPCDDCKDLQYYYDWILNRGCNDKYVTAF